MSPMPDFRVEVQRLEERIEDGLRRLGSHFEKDSRSRNFPIQQWIVDHGGTYQTDPTKLTSKRWTREIPILDQGDLGSCTGNAVTGMLGCDPLFKQDGSEGSVLNEDFAVKMYSTATRLDGLGSPFYPPNDRGSTTLGVLKAAQRTKWIKEYRWGFGLVDALNMIAQVGACVTGVAWYDGFDSPQSDGGLIMSGGVRGGHELCLDEIDVENRRVWGDNSWGSNWDQGGRFYWSWDTYGQLLAAQGEVGIGVKS